MLTRRLSPTALNLFRECSRCFWLDKVKGIRRPRGIFPSLPSGMDRVIKEYFDSHRKAGVLPPEVKVSEIGSVSLFPDQRLIDDWRDWRSGLEYKDVTGVVLFGAIDDLLVQGETHFPLDYKTKGSPTTQEDSEKYYQNQLDCYALMLKANGMKLGKVGVLLYLSPKKVSANQNVLFDVQTIQVQIDPNRAIEVLRAADKVLRGAIPEVTSTCEYCSWYAQRSSFAKSEGVP